MNRCHWPALLFLVGCTEAGTRDTGADSTLPAPSIQTSTESGWLAVESGFDHTCGIHSDGEIRCWGKGADEARADPTNAPDGPMSRLDSGMEFACSVDPAGGGH